MKEMSKRLACLAEITVVEKFRNKYVRLPETREDKQTAGIFLNRFGGLITHLQIGKLDQFIDLSELNGQTLDSLMEGCTKLTHLRLRNVDFMNHVSFEGLFRQLRKIFYLEMRQCYTSQAHLPDVFQKCRNLKIFTCDGDIEYRVLEAIIKYGKCLERLNFKDCAYDEHMRTTEICAFAKHLWKLKKLKSLEFGPVKTEFVRLILLEMKETKSKLSKQLMIAFDGYLPQYQIDNDNEFFEMIKELKITCKLYNNGEIDKKLFPAAEGLNITRDDTSNSKKYRYVHTISPSRISEALPKPFNLFRGIKFS